MTLADMRATLDEIDAALLELLARRAAVVGELWAWKDARGLPRFDPAREASLRAALARRAGELGLSPAAVDAIFAAIVGHDLRAPR